MTPEAQRVAIAEACGWRDIRPSVASEEIDWGPWLVGWNKCGKAEVPDYLNDLNAMHEAEKVLTSTDEQEYDYSKTLKRVCDHNWTWKATAAQRAEAFLKTLNLWKE